MHQLAGYYERSSPGRLRKISPLSVATQSLRNPAGARKQENGKSGLVRAVKRESTFHFPVTGPLQAAIPFPYLPRHCKSNTDRGESTSAPLN